MESNFKIISVFPENGGLGFNIITYINDEKISKISIPGHEFSSFDEEIKEYLDCLGCSDQQINHIKELVKDKETGIVY